MKYYKKIKVCIGNIIIIEENNSIIELKINSNPDKEDHLKKKDTQLLLEAESQLKEYFKGNRKYFDLPLKPNGTDFMKKVWNELLKIPYGETRSYKEIAENINNPKACRAVGKANNKNPIPIIIPCHRVIGKTGKLVGYALGLDIKQFLLNLEK